MSDRRPDLIVRNAEVGGRLVDVSIDGRMIVGIVASRSPTSPQRGAADEIDAAGGALIPGLHDHHIHVMALAAARTSLTVDDSFAESLRAAVVAAAPGAWIRAVGHDEATSGELDRSWLDAIAPDHPVRVQHRSGAMWVLNSAALRQIGIDSADGRLFRVDEDLRSRLPRSVPDVGPIGRELATVGITGVSDLTPTSSETDMRTFLDLVARPDFPVHVMATGAPSLSLADLPELAPMPAKVVVTDHELPTIDALVEAFRTARRQRRAVAVHCVTRVGLILALAAWEVVGARPGDRIEHAAVVPIELIPTIRELGLVVVTQPSFTHERGDDYLRDVDASDIDGLWRCGSLIDAGVPVGGSSDAPYGDPDPWAAIRAATTRRTATGAPIGDRERISAARALAMYLSDPLDPGGPPRRVEVGRPADLCLLDGPLTTVLCDPSSDHVVATVGRSGAIRR